MADDTTNALRALADELMREADQDGRGALTDFGWRRLAKRASETIRAALAAAQAEAKPEGVACAGCEELRRQLGVLRVMWRQAKGLDVPLATAPVEGSEEGAPAATGRGNVIDHPRKPPPCEPLSAEAMAAHREEARRLGHPMPGPGPNEATRQAQGGGEGYRG